MFQKDIRFTYLVDFYGELLDEHTRAVITAYYDDDLSLAEIADDVGISRQGVRHIIKRGEEQLTTLEEKLGLVKRHRELAAAEAELTDIARKVTLSSDESLRGIGERIAEIAAGIGEK